MARDACKIYPNISPEDMRWVMVEGAGRILPEVGPALGEYTVRELEKRGIQVKLKTFLESCVDRRVQLSDGTKIGGLHDRVDGRRQAEPGGATDFGVPLGERGHVKALPTLQVEGFADVWAAGDGAQVPDLTDPEGKKFCSPSAQHAVRQAKQLADNVVASSRGFEPREYKHKHVGSVASLGLHKGVARRLRRAAARLAGLVHAPDLPHEPGPHLQPQDPGHRRLDAGAVLPPRGRGDGRHGAAARRVRRGRR